MRPVRVARSALDDNVPAADLWLSAPHSLYIDGVLMSVVNLVNGTTIAFDEDVGGDELESIPIELATHDAIDAECRLRVAADAVDDALRASPGPEWRVQRSLVEPAQPSWPTAARRRHNPRQARRAQPLALDLPSGGGRRPVMPGPCPAGDTHAAFMPTLQRC